MAGIDRMTGRPLGGFAHVVQSINLIMATRLGERVIRRHVGSSAVTLLGRMLTAAHVARFFSIFAVAIELWEPRFRVVRVIAIRTSVAAVRNGSFAFALEGEYRPRGHLGDPTPEGVRRIDFTAKNARLIGVST